MPYMEIITYLTCVFRGDMSTYISLMKPLPSAIYTYIHTYMYILAIATMSQRQICPRDFKYMPYVPITQVHQRG